VIFRIDTAGKFTVLFTFSSKVICCGGGYNILVRDSKGNLYDTTPTNGPHNGGFLFELDTTGKFTVLFDFPYQGENGDGQFVNSIAMDKHGNFYGTMQLGGDFNCGRGDNGCGTVFKLAKNGATPDAGLIRDSAGNLYRTAYTSAGFNPGGTVFKVTP